MVKICAFVAKLMNVANTPFLGLFWTMSHLRAFVANQVLSRLRVVLGLFCPDFYSDIEDLTQILCRYLPKTLTDLWHMPRVQENLTGIHFCSFSRAGQPDF